MLEEIRAFQEWLRENHPASQPKLTQGPSGRILLELEIGTQAYAVEYLPAKGFEISTISTSTFGWEPIGKPSRDFREIKADMVQGWGCVFCREAIAFLRQALA